MHLTNEETVLVDRQAENETQETLPGRLITRRKMRASPDHI